MNHKDYLLDNADKIHTTDLGIERIRNNLKINADDVVKYCITIIKKKESIVSKKGKNFYVYQDDNKITINSSSFTIITAHKIKK